MAAYNTVYSCFYSTLHSLVPFVCGYTVPAKNFMLLGLLTLSVSVCVRVCVCVCTVCAIHGTFCRKNILVQPVCCSSLALQV